jgi:hypothetical protein
MLLVLGVDGTGEADDTLYEKIFAKSHVRRMAVSDGGRFKTYRRGPTTDDFDESQIPRKISSLLKLTDNSGDRKPSWGSVLHGLRDRLDPTDPRRAFNSLLELVGGIDETKLPRTIASFLRRDDRDALLEKLNQYRSETHKLGRQVYDEAIAARELDDKLRLVLIGYSRGGAAVIHAAQLLKEKAQVDAMFLFDAVDRSLGVETDRIPSNVRLVRHARRDPWSRSRLYFGNCGTQWDKSRTDYETAVFRCTHGALGGTPWARPDDRTDDDFVHENRVRTGVTFAQDAAGAELVWKWMQQHFDSAIRTRPG